MVKHWWVLALLLALVVPARAEEPFGIVVVIAPALLERSSFAADVSLALNRAGRILEPDLGRELSLVRIGSWPRYRPAVDANELLLNLLSTVTRGPGDIVIGIAPSTTRKPSAAATSYEEGYVAVAARGSVRDMERLLAHELAHVFGAIHTSDESTLMHERVGGAEIDPLNRKLIALHRHRRFKSVAFPLERADLERARLLFSEALPAIEAKLMIARLDVEQGRYSEAVASLEPMVESRPDDSELVVLLAIAYRRAGRYEEALRLYDRILSSGPNARVEYNRGIALSKRGDSSAAMAAYEQALELAPHFQPAMANLGQVLLERGMTAEATAMLKRALELEPDDLNARATVGFALFVSGDLEQAKRLTEDVLQRDSNSAPALNTLGKLREAECAAADPCAGAIEVFQRAIDVDPNYPEPALNLAQLHLERGDAATAASLARHALSMRPRWAAARVILARTLQRQEQWQEALAELTTAVRDAPELAAAHAELGHVRVALGRTAAAKEAYERAVQLGSRSGMLHNNLAVVCFRLGMLDQAWTHALVARALGVEPHRDFVAELERRLARAWPP